MSLSGGGNIRIDSTWGKPDGERCMGMAVKTEPPRSVLVLNTPVDNHFPGLPETLSPFELCISPTQRLLGFY